MGLSGIEKYNLGIERLSKEPEIADGLFRIGQRMEFIRRLGEQLEGSRLHSSNRKWEERDYMREGINSLFKHVNIKIESGSKEEENVEALILARDRSFEHLNEAWDHYGTIEKIEEIEILFLETFSEAITLAGSEQFEEFWVKLLNREEL